MQRKLHTLNDTFYDVVIVGGGIHGATALWDATLRGLNALLLERHDFGSGTSANSLKTLHGGLRYLQDFDLNRVRMMARERHHWQRIAPHLIRPVPFVLPTSGFTKRSRTVMRSAMLLNDQLSKEHNQHLPEFQQIPKGSLLSRVELRRLMDTLIPANATGAAVWHDAQMLSSERLLLAFIKGATQRGATACNYVEATSLLTDDGRIIGVRARDQLTGNSYTIRSATVINAAGAWVDELAQQQTPMAQLFRPSSAVNLVTRPLHPTHAVGINGRYAGLSATGRQQERTRTLFIVPWGHYSLIGTFHAHLKGKPSEFTVTPEDVDEMLAEVNAACPGVNLTRADVCHIHAGFLPADPKLGESDELFLIREGDVFLHDIEGLFNLVGVKYTTSRLIAEKVIDAVATYLDVPLPPVATHKTPLPGGEIEDMDAYVQEAVENRPELVPEATIRHLITQYGTGYRRILEYVSADPALRMRLSRTSLVMRAELIHAIDQEMALTLDDLVRRRTALGTGGPPRGTDGSIMSSLQACNELVAPLLGWDETAKRQEMNRVLDNYRPVLQLTNSPDAVWQPTV